MWESWRQCRGTQAMAAGALVAFLVGMEAALATALAAEAGAYFPAVYVLTLALCLIGTVLFARRGLALACAPDLGTSCWLLALVVLSGGVTLSQLYAGLLAAGAVLFLLARLGAAGRIADAFPACLRAALPLALGLLLLLWGAERGRLLLPSPLHLVMLGDFADPLAYFSLLGILTLLVLRAARVSALRAVLAAFLVVTVLSLVEGFWIVPPAPFYLPEGLDRSAGLFLRAGEGDATALAQLMAAFPWLVVTLLLTAWGTQAALFSRQFLAPIAALNALAAAAGVLPLAPAASSVLAGRAGARAPRAFALGAAVVFCLLLFLAPLLREVISFPAMLVVLVLSAGLLLVRRARLREVRLFEERLAALTLVVLVPLTRDLALGLGLSLVTYVLLRRAARRPVPRATCVLAALFVLLTVFSACLL